MNLSRLDRTTLITVSVMFIVVAVLGWYTVHVYQNRNRDKSFPSRPLAELAASSTYKSLTGEVVSLDTTNSDITIVTTWASWCPDCSQHLAAVQAAADSFAPQYSVRTLAFNRSDAPAVLRQFLSRYPLPEGMEAVADPQDTLFEHIDGRTIPETIIVNQNGDLIKTIPGVIATSKLRLVIDQALERQ